MTLTRSDLTAHLFEKIGIPRQEVSRIVDAFFSEIVEALERGEPVKLSGFGAFSTRDKNARPGRNPKTGRASTVSARRVVVFHPSPKLKTTVLLAHERIKESGEIAA